MVYWPEGRRLGSGENREACACFAGLADARARALVLEGVALGGAPGQGMSVALGRFVGFIPWGELALGGETENRRALSARMGKPVSVVVTALEGSSRPLLSRKKAQEKAQAHFLQTEPGTVLPATVTHLPAFGAFVDLGCGVSSLVGIRDCSVSRVCHPACRFSLGQEIFVLLTGSDPETGRVFLSHKELLGTWQENAARFSPGQVTTGVVRGVQPYGTFIELAPNLTGLTEQTTGLRENDRVRVRLHTIQPKTRKLKLSVLSVEPQTETTPPPLPYFITDGRLAQWEYTQPRTEKAERLTPCPSRP